MDILPFVDQPETVDESPRPDAIPPAVWALLQEAGSVAAGRLLDLLHSKAFERLKVGDQTRLIQLALDRAYGPPIKREMSLTLSGTVSDAVSEALAAHAGLDLPEMRTSTARSRAKVG